MRELDDILKRLERSSCPGRRTLSTGVRLIGHLPNVGPDAWLHKVYPGLTREEIQDLEAEVGPLPAILADFWRHANGVNFFLTRLSVYGRRTSFARSGEEAFQPFSVVSMNQYERPGDANPNLFFFGGYSSDGSRLYIDRETLSVYRCARNTCKPLNEWWSFGEMLTCEFERLDRLLEGVADPRTVQGTTP